MFNFAGQNWTSFPMGGMFNFLTFKYEEPIQITLFNWISLGNLNINFGILLDPLSMVVMVPIGVVTSAVLFYSIDYMRYDPARNRFYVVLSVFALFMTLLIVSDNYVTMFIGWELIGVISYLLISFWNTRISAMKSALSAILLNRMGDALFVIFIGTIISLYNSVEFNTIELLTPHTHTTTLNLLAIMLLIAATAKSAQLGLHSWLLLAMESGRTRLKLRKLRIIYFTSRNVWSEFTLSYTGVKFIFYIYEFIYSSIIFIRVINLILLKLGATELIPVIDNSNFNKFSSYQKGDKPTEDNLHLIKNKENITSLSSKGKKSTSIFSKIWVYDVNTAELINDKPFYSKVECSNYLGFTRNTILKYIKTGELYKGKYLFSARLTVAGTPGRCPGVIIY